MALNHGKDLRLRVKVPVRDLLGGTAQENLWIAIRNLKSFTTTEVAFAASTDKLKVTDDVAMRYLRRLRDAGYLKLVLNLTSEDSNWRLVPRMNTGPKPPMMLQVNLVFDRNQGLVQDGPHSEECVL
ncbi:MAG: hypothetical protein ACRC9K_12345 [Afipia sp.]